MPKIIQLCAPRRGAEYRGGDGKRLGSAVYDALANAQPWWMKCYFAKRAGLQRIGAVFWPNHADGI
jgi:hypothetical protein